MEKKIEIAQHQSHGAAKPCPYHASQRHYPNLTREKHPGFIQQTETRATGRQTPPLTAVP